MRLPSCFEGSFREPCRRSSPRAGAVDRRALRLPDLRPGRDPLGAATRRADLRRGLLAVARRRARRGRLAPVRAPPRPPLPPPGDQERVPLDPPTRGRLQPLGWGRGAAAASGDGVGASAWGPLLMRRKRDDPSTSLDVVLVDPSRTSGGLRAPLDVATDVRKHRSQGHLAAMARGAYVTRTPGMRVAAPLLFPQLASR